MASANTTVQTGTSLPSPGRLAAHFMYINICIDTFLSHSRLHLLPRSCYALTGVQPPLIEKNKTYTNLLCPVDVEAMPGGSLPDIESSDHAIQLLANLTRRTAEEAVPFFIAIGYHKVSAAAAAAQIKHGVKMHSQL